MNLNVDGWRVACHGSTAGRACTVRSQEDLKRVKSGDILIAAQTDMNYTPQMLAASAVITVEGGRYCHAAIFCRENAIVCIVGVKDALSEIPDGAVIRVDTSVPSISWGEM